MIIRRSVSDKESVDELFSRKSLDRILKKEAIEFGLHVNACRYVNGCRENLSPPSGKASAANVWKLFDKDRATLQFHQPQQYQVKMGDGLCVKCVNG